jgi:hypothetical protein
MIHIFCVLALLMNACSAAVAALARLSGLRVLLGSQVERPHSVNEYFVGLKTAGGSPAKMTGRHFFVSILMSVHYRKRLEINGSLDLHR